MAPIADNIFRFELRYEQAGGSDPQGTCVKNDWNSDTGSTVSAGTCISTAFDESSSCPKVARPYETLPRAVHITLCALDSRYSSRVYSIIGTNGLSSTELAKLPYCTDTMSNSALANIFREGLRTFFRTVYLKNSNS